MQNIRLDAGAAALLARLHGAGYAAYAVGGCVRDSLLGRTPQDWDLCTSARPEQVLALFGEGQCIPTGLQHGTVTIKYGGQLYETTTFRTEGVMKPLSGSGARGMMLDAMNTYGADSFIGRLCSIVQGSSDTTFYVVALYFGSVKIRNTYYTIPCSLLADLAGAVAAVAMTYLFFT